MSLDQTDEQVGAKAAGDEPLPGYRLIEPLGRGGFGEVWKCEAPGGLFKAIKFVAENHDAGGNVSLRQEFKAFQRIKAIRHPFLLMLERVELIPGELVMVMELADSSLQVRFDECRAAGLPGIPRDELLKNLADAAEALDLICSRFGLQHLDIKPANLFLVCGHLKVGDYGMVATLEAASNAVVATPRRGFTPKYTPPEVLKDHIDPRSDQYSLALVYQELLTGEFPFPVKSPAQLMMHHASAVPDLTALPAADRAFVQRALAKNPADRFPSCTEFIESLQRVSPGRAQAGPAATGPGATRGPRPGRTLTEELGSIFPGFRVVEEIESGPLGQVVRAATADGCRYRVRLLRDCNLTLDLKAQAVVAAVQALDHTGVVQRFGLAPGMLAALAAPEGRPTLADLYKSRVERGLPGVPLWDLLIILAGVARALDEVFQSTRLHHLLLQPVAVVVEKDSAAVTDFGWGELLRCRHPDGGWAEHSPYAAPEVGGGNPGPASDQYSLALIFLEMIQAWKPPAGRKESAPLVFTERLTDVTWEVVRKAIHRDPAQRFDTCSQFVAALREAVFPAGAPQVVLRKLRRAVAVGLLTGRGAGSLAVPPPETIIRAAVAAACPADSPHRIGPEPVQAADGAWWCRFPVRLMERMVELKVRVLHEWGLFDVEQTDRTTYVLQRLEQAGGIWDKLTGKKKKSGIEVVLRVPGNDQVVNGIGIVESTARLLGTTGANFPTPGGDLPGLLREVRRQVQNVPERRQWPRVPAGLTMSLYPVGDDGEVYPPIVCSGRDLSEGGFSCTSPVAVRARSVYAEFGGVGELAGVAVLARVLRSEPAPDGTSIVAGQFVDSQ